MQTKNPNVKSLWICEYCNKEFSRPSLLKEHRRVHTGERPFRCNLCSFSATTKTNLHVHIKSHLQEKLYKCPEPDCNYSSVQSGNLKTHQFIHTPEKRFSCPFPLCSYKTGHKSNLTVHLRTHEENRAKPFQCELCPFKTTQGNNLNSHKSQVHCTERKLRCEEAGCSYAGKTRADLNQHARALKEKRLNCPHPNCDFKTNLRQGLQQHMNIHSEDKKYKCRICKFAAHQAGSLVLHMRIHIKERPYKCPVVECPFEAARKGGLNHHVKAVHQCLRPFQCPSCDYASTCKFYLKKHQNSRHPESRSQMDD